jgi:short-subunit dehydrogenase
MRKGDLAARYGKTALVTGASSGIGEAFARLLSEAGLDIIAVSNEEEALNRLAGELKKSNGARVLPLAGDLTEKPFLKRLEKIEAEWEPGILVNCAGAGLMGYFIQHPFESFESLLRLDEAAPLELMHRFCLNWYKRGKRGAVINVSSANSDFHSGIPFSAVYSASKSMLRYVTEGVHHEMKSFGIDLISVSPGPTRTAFQEKAGTNTLWFCETARSVAEKTIKALGLRASISTNPWTRLILALYRLTPATPRAKMRFRAYVFRKVLGKEENCTLDGVKAQGTTETE